MINPAIVKLLTEKDVEEAIKILKQFNKNWQIHSRDGVLSPTLAHDRDDNRYNLILYHNKVSRVLAG